MPRIILMNTPLLFRGFFPSPKFNPKRGNPAPDTTLSPPLMRSFHEQLPKNPIVFLYLLEWIWRNDPQVVHGLSFSAFSTSCTGITYGSPKVARMQVTNTN